MTDFQKNLVIKVFGCIPEVPEIYQEAKQFYNPLTTHHDMIVYVWMALYTEDEVRMLLTLPANSKEVAEKTGFDEAYVCERLNGLAKDGKLMYTPTGFARLAPNMTLTLDFLYFAYEGKKIPYTQEELNILQMVQNSQRSRVGMAPENKIKLPMRIIPKHGSIKNVPGVMPCEDVMQILTDSAKLGILAYERCVCKVMSSYWSKGSYPAEGDDNPNYLHEGCCNEGGHCFQVGTSGKYFNRFLASYSGNEEDAIKKVEEIEETTTICIANNSRLTTNICCCHFDYCNPYYMEAWEYIPSRFRPVKRERKCLYCGKCAEVCQFHAIDKNGFINLPDKCMGCGNCVTKCSGKALKMEIVHTSDWIPEA
ncbi:MAG: 4Fe-4S binding protein [Lachnospiraceae bacterium]|nr:4Fe-4S binding protein [Lachnospiraceae bacterium]